MYIYLLEDLYVVAPTLLLSLFEQPSYLQVYNYYFFEQFSLAEYLEFADSFTKACHRFDFDGNKENEEFAKMIGESLEDFSTMLFQREIMHTVSTLYDVSETLRSYVQDPQAAQNHMRAILKLYNL